jgi:lipopolysaccharide/colanic/teichoic acid biosynthesis glycosyltransferase
MYNNTKRFFDLICSLIGILVLSPILAPIILALSLTGEGKVFYKQNRVGYKNRNFKIWKFATMLKNSPNMGTGSLTLRNDPRVTTVGKYLRKSKINEFPQLINVITGEMSLVGPRPQMEVDYKAFPENVQTQIYNVLPGITGIGSIVFRDEERLISASDIAPRAFYEQYIAPYKGALEIWYQAHQSFVTDFLLLWLTVWVVLFPTSRAVYRCFPTLPPRPAFLEIG